MLLAGFTSSDSGDNCFKSSSFLAINTLLSGLHVLINSILTDAEWLVALLGHSSTLVLMFPLHSGMCLPCTSHSPLVSY